MLVLFDQTENFDARLAAAANGTDAIVKSGFWFRVLQTADKRPEKMHHFGVILNLERGEIAWSATTKTVNNAGFL